MKFFGLIFATALWTPFLSASDCPQGNLACRLDYDLYCINEELDQVIQESLLASVPSHPLASPVDVKKNPKFSHPSEDTLVIEAADFQTDNTIVKYTFKIVKELKEDGSISLNGKLFTQNSEPADLNCRSN